MDGNELKEDSWEVEGPENQNAQLSERELEILRLVATGLSNKEVASRLFLSVNTVKVHLRNIFAKIGAQSRTEATMYAVTQGWVTIPQAVVGTAEESPVEGGASAPVAPEMAPRVVITPPLPWAKRIALIVIVLGVALGLALTWPRSESAGTGQSCEFINSPDCKAPIATGASGSSWQTGAQMPTSRGRLALAAVSGKLYAIGGDTLTGVTGIVEVYDLRTNLWASASSKPLPVANIAAGVLGARIYVPGGCNASGTPTSVVEVYDSEQDQWSSAVAGLPAPVCAYALVEYQQKLYLFGGSNGRTYTSASYVYDPQADRWTAIMPLPTARGFAAAAVVGEAIYVVGGYDGLRDLAVCERYYPAADRWEACAPLAVGRGGLGLVASANKLYTIGGGWNGYLAFGERYNPDSDTWIAVDTPLTGQWRNLAATSVGVDIYAVGGWDGQSHLSVNLAYSPFPIKIFLPLQSGSGN